jgi:hypothetical protein
MAEPQQPAQPQIITINSGASSSSSRGGDDRNENEREGRESDDD